MTLGESETVERQQREAREPVFAHIVARDVREGDGKMVLRGDVSAIQFPQQTAQHPAAEEDLCEIRPLVERFAKLFGHDAQALMAGPFTVVTPEGRNPYQQMYVAN